MLKHIFFDFFGTLVAYSPSRRDQGYSISHKILKDAGARHSYDEFLDLWCIVSEEFDANSAATDREYSIMEVGEVFLRRTFGQQPQAQLTSRFVSAYLAEWNKGVHYLPNLPGFVERLSKRYTLGVITNTSDSEIVMDHLERTGAPTRRAAHMSGIVLKRTIEVRWRPGCSLS
jgi:putative hydrolase of the HAD superfamily